MKAKTKHHRKTIIKLSILLVILVVSAVLIGCVRGLQPVGWSGMAISDGVLYVGSTEGMLVSVASDGTRDWSELLRYPRAAGGLSCAPAAEGGTGGACASSSSAGVAIYGTPVVSGDLVYLGAYNGKVYAFNRSLELRWIYPREDYLRPIVGGVALSEGKIYFGTAGGVVLALDAATGDKLWESKVGDKIWSTPVVNQGTVYVTSFDKKLHAFDASNGAQKWDFQTGGTITATPLVYNDTVYIGSFDRKLYAVDTAGNKKWEFQADEWFWSAPVAYENVIYAGSLDGNVYALNAQNGEEIATFTVGPVSASPALAGNLVIVATEAGELYSIDTVSHDLKRLADLGVHISSQIAVNNDVVYVHTSDLSVRPVNITTGAKLATISLKKESS